MGSISGTPTWALDGGHMGSGYHAPRQRDGQTATDINGVFVFHNYGVRAKRMETCQRPCMRPPGCRTNIHTEYIPTYIPVVAGNATCGLKTWHPGHLAWLLNAGRVLHITILRINFLLTHRKISQPHLAIRIAIAFHLGRLSARARMPTANKDQITAAGIILRPSQHTLQMTARARIASYDAWPDLSVRANN